VSNIFNVARWEWFKLGRRRMPWILLALLLAFTQLGIWGTYVGYKSAASSGGSAFVQSPNGRPQRIGCDAVQEGRTTIDAPEQALRTARAQCQQQRTRLAGQFRSLTPTGGISTALGIASTLGLVLAGILSALAIGAEYGLGTLRPILVRGAGRVPYLAGQLSMLYVVTACALVIVAVAAGVGGLAAGKLAGAPPDFVVEAAANRWASVASSLAKTWVGLVTFVTMTGALTVLTRSTATGMAIGLGYYVAEGILVRLLTAVFDWFEPVGDYLPMRNISAFAGGNFNLTPALGGGSTIEPLQAGIVLVAYIALFSVMAGLVFFRRDIVGASGR
jgi:hypothetical protein